MDPPHFVFKCAPPVRNQCKFQQCYATGATLSCGMTLAVFWYNGGTSIYPQITGPRASEKIEDNHEHHHDSNKLISSSSLVPILPTLSSSPHTPTPHEFSRATRKRRTVCFFMQHCLPGNVTRFKIFGRGNSS